MKKRLFAFTLLLLLLLPTAVLAAEEQPLIVDNAELFTAEEKGSLEAQARSLSDTYKMDVVVLTTNTLSGKRPQDYADDYYDAAGYGQGADASGMLLLISMEDRDWYLSTCGDAIYALTDYGIEQLGMVLVSGLQVSYADGITDFFNALPEYLDAYQNGSVIDGWAGESDSFYHGDQENVVYYKEPGSADLTLSVILGLVIAVISVGAMVATMNTKRRQHGASSYLTKGSLHFPCVQDLFLYSNVTKTRKPEPQNHSGGGSSVHHSSSGRSHGGGGGKF